MLRYARAVGTIFGMSRGEIRLLDYEAGKLSKSPLVPGVDGNIAYNFSGAHIATGALMMVLPGKSDWEWHIVSVDITGDA